MNELIKILMNNYKVTQSENIVIVEETKYGKLRIDTRANTISIINQNVKFGCADKWIGKNLVGDDSNLE